MVDKLDRVTTKLSGIRRAVKRLFVIDGISRIVLLIVLFFTATFLIDWALDVPKEVRLLFLSSGIVIIIIALIRYIIYPATVKITDDDLAIMIEEKYPQLNDELISAIQLSRESRQGMESGKQTADDFNSPSLIQVVVEGATKSSYKMDFNSIIVRKNAINIFFTASFVLLLLICLAFYFGTYSSIYFSRLIGRDIRWPQQTYLSIEGFEGGKKIIAKGDDLIITAMAKGRIPKKAFIYYKFDRGEDGRDRMKAVNLEDGRFEYLFPKVTGPLNFHVEGGDDVTSVYNVYTLTPPTVESIVHLLEYPKYTGLANTLNDRPGEGGNIRAAIGTKVSIKCSCNEEIETAKLTISVRDSEKTTAMKIEKDAKGEDKVIKGTFVVADISAEYTITLKAKNGLFNRDPIRYTIKGIVDNGPMISVKDPVTDEYLTDIAVRPLTIETSDDYGILEIALSYKVVSQPNAVEHPITFGSQENTPAEYGVKLIKSIYNLDISKLKVKQGDAVEYHYKATDNAEKLSQESGIVEHNVTKTKSYRFWIVSVAELEKRLAADIEAIKNELRIQKRNEELLKQRTTNISKKYGKIGDLAQEQKAEIKSVELDQNQISQKIEGVTKKIDAVLKQGIYNKIFDEKSAQKLEGVKGILVDIIDSAVDKSKIGKSSTVSMLINSAYKSKSGADRVDVLDRAEKIQDDIVLDLMSALALLEEWATYQEVVRMTREILEAQKGINSTIKPK